MDGEEVIIQQIGLILMQLRFARRALEEVERNTARYTGVSFSNALAAGPRFGEPPLLNGALKVHVVNISDLNPGTSIGGLIEGILGGVGRFFGGFMGGVVGGVASTITLPYLLVQMVRVTDNINRILEQINIIKGPGGSTTETSEASGSGINLNQWTTTMNALTNLFTAASRGPGNGGEGGAVEGEVPEGWLVMLYTTSRLVESISRVVDGFILLIPIAIGAIASLILRIDDIKLKVLELIQFALRNVFLLRGVALVTIYDTLAGIAGLGANIMRVVSTAVGSIITSVFDAIAALLNLTVEALRFVGSGLQRTMNGLLEWLRTGLGTFLIDIGRTDVFRLLHHLVQTLPLILPSLVLLVQNRELSQTDRDALQQAAAMPLPGSPLVGGMPAFTSFPDIGELMVPADQVTALVTTLDDSRRAITDAVTGSFNAAERGLEGIQSTLRRESTRAMGLFARDDDPRLVALRGRADALAGALRPAVDAARERPETGLEAIARAYETWVSGGGLQTILNRLTDHFSRTPTTGPDSERAIVGRIVAASAGAAEPPTATIRIDRVEIEVAPPAPPAGSTGESDLLLAMQDHFLSPAFVERLQAQIIQQEREWVLRGGDPCFVGMAASAFTT
jgi:hypothetical protein